MKRAETASIPELFQQTVSQYPDHVAIRFGDRDITFSEVDKQSDLVAASLIKRGIKPQERIALYCVNSDIFAIAYLGIVKAGATVVPINLLLNPKEIEYILNDAEVKGLIYHEAFAASVSAFRESVPDLTFCVHIGQGRSGEQDISWSDLLTSASSFTGITIDPKDYVASIIYTSGTTGKPKGAMLTHRNLVSNTGGVFEAVKIVPDQDVLLVVLPMFHAFAATVGMLLPLLRGCAFIPVPKFDPELVVNAIADGKATIFLGVPSMYNVLLNLSDDHINKLSSLRFCISGGAAMPQELMKRFEERFGILIYEGDGPTECSPVTAVNPIEGVRKPASIGIPIPGVEMSIRNPEGKEVPVKDIGEICVRGPNIMKGYWNRAEETAEAFFNDWFRTGDLGYQDEDGYFYIIDRIKDMIIVNGMNVYPRVIEEVLYQYEPVKEAAVVGEPNELHGEIIIAYIVLKDGVSATSADIRSFCRENLGRHQIPKKVFFLKELPKNAAGKILKRELRKHGEIERGIDNREPD